MWWGGILVLSVPYDKTLTQCKEHYPNCKSYKVLNENGHTKVIIEYENYTSEATSPCFHGGPGNTLEMRIFSLSELVDFIQSIGFAVEIYENDVREFGIIYGPQKIGILVCKKIS